MHRPRFQQPESSGNPEHEPVASQPDPAALLHDIDVGLETIEATLAELERESTQYRHSLGGISGAARLFDEAGLVAEATTMHEGEQTIAEALSENERRRVELTQTALKLRLAREQIAPTGVDVAANLTAAAAQLELTRETQVARHDNGAVAERPVWTDNQDTVRFAPPAAPAQHSDSVSGSLIMPAPVTVAPKLTTTNADIDALVAVVAANDASGRRRTPLIVGALLLIVLAGGTYLLASALGGQDDDDASSRSSAPAAATDVPSLPGSSVGEASATTSAGAALIVPSPTSTEQPAVMMSPTPPMPTPTAPPPPTVAPQVAATTPPIPSIAPTLPPTPSTEPTPQPTAIELATVVERVAGAEAALQSGQIDASIEYPDGARATTRIMFDLGAPGGTPSVAISTTYQNDAQTRTTELIMLGSQVWERVDGSTWEEVENVEGGRGQVQVFLPRIALVAEPQRDSDDRPGALHWYDAARNADIRLQVDPESGVPEQLRQVSRETGSVLTVTYTSWNGPVQIDPPAIP
jgi:hypothetical protein